MITGPAQAKHASVSIICVYNDLAVRQQCLDRSIQFADDAADIEYLPIDNVNGTFPTAGAALNHGASLAKNDVIAFVHQDVFLHSLAALKEAASQISAGEFGVLGAVGVSSNGRIVGRIRDRVVLLGDAVARPTDVDSVDEVLFLASRLQLLRDPLTESPDLAWHAYAVEYGLRVRKRGQRIGVADIPLTHNSLTVNLDRLDIAHRAIAARYDDLLPVRTTCGLVTRKTAKAGRVLFSSHRWRYQWLRESLAMQGIPKPAGRGYTVLADIRRDVDSVIDSCPGRRLHIVNLSQDSHFVDCGTSPLELSRRDGNVVLAACNISDIPAAIANSSPDSWLLLTNLSRTDLKMLDSRLSGAYSVLGFYKGIGYWLLFGALPRDLPPQWRLKRAVPPSLSS